MTVLYSGLPAGPAPTLGFKPPKSMESHDSSPATCPVDTEAAAAATQEEGGRGGEKAEIDQ